MEMASSAQMCFSSIFLGWLFIISDASINCPVTKPCRCVEKAKEDKPHTIKTIDVLCNDKLMVYPPLITWETRPENVRVDVFNLSNTSINRHIKSDYFRILYPRVVDLSDNLLQSIDINAFRGLENRLEELYLADNALLSFNKSLISRLYVLQSLDISNTDDLSENVFPKSTSLKKLYRSSNYLETLSPLICVKLVNLVHLILSENDFSTIPESISKCHFLEKFDMGDNDINNIHKNVFLTTHNLKWLSLKQNGDIQLNETSFKGLENSLEYLFLEDLDDKVIPHKALSILRALKFLYMYKININHIDKIAFEGLESLEGLTISDNEFKIVLDESAFSGINNTLKQLSLAKNKLTAVPKAVNTLSLLEELDLSGNLFVNIYHGDFKNLRMLKVLKLNNLRATIDVDAFRYIGQSLIEIQLKNVQISELPHAVRSLSSLEKLDVSNNKFETIGENFFKGVTAWCIALIGCNVNQISFLSFKKLHTRIHRSISLDIRSNNLSNVQFISEVDVFAKVNIANNPIICDCHLLTVSFCWDVVINGRCLEPRPVQWEVIGSEVFNNTMARTCGSTLRSRKHCPKTGDVRQVTPLINREKCENGQDSENCVTKKVNKGNNSKVDIWFVCVVIILCIAAFIAPLT